MTHPNPVKPGRSYGSYVARFVQAFAALFAVMFASAVLTAAEAPKKYFDIPADNAEKSLKTFASQSDLEVLFVTEATNGVRTQAVRGEMTPHEALDKLLDGTPLVATENGKSGAVKIRREASLAEAEKNGASRPVKTDRAASGSTTEDGAIKLDTFEVFGRKTLNMDIRRTIDDVQPYRVYNREALERSGAQNINDFFRTRTTLAADFQANDQLNTAASGGASNSSINLRGLGSSQTLILVDGRRQANVSVGLQTGQPDLNGIPLDAVERIEILPTTASGIYGGSATGGVINIVLRRDYEGMVIKATVRGSFEGGAGQNEVSITAGANFNGGRTSVLFAANYSASDPLLLGARDFVPRARAYTQSVNPTFYFSSSTSAPLGRTANIVGFVPATGALTNLTLKSGGALNSPFTFVPVGYGGVASDGGAGLVSNAGKFNFDLANTAQAGGAKQSLLNGPTVKSASLTLRNQFSQSLQAFLDSSVSENHGEFIGNNVAPRIRLLASSPGNPFNQDINVTTPAVGADQVITNTLKAQKLSGGVIVGLPREWKAEADVSWSHNEYTYTDLARADATGITNAVRAGTLDVFRDTNVSGLNFTSFLAPRSTLKPVETRLLDYAIRASGQLWALPAGPIELSALTEYREQRYGAYDSVINFTAATVGETKMPERSQRVASAYAELMIPLVSERNRKTGLELLEVQVAARWDDYKSHGANSQDFLNGANVGDPAATGDNRVHSIDPTVGLKFKPTRSLMFRASYGTGFLPPDVNLLVRVPNGQFAPNLTDPLRGNEALGVVNILGGGSPDLKPERSRSWSTGVVIAPPAIPSLRVGVDYTKIQKRDNIVSLPLNQDLLANLINYAPERITRGAPTGSFTVGPITGLDISAVNFARQDVEAFDLSLDYALPSTSHGKFSLSALATYTPHNLFQITPTAPVVEAAGAAYVGAVGSVKWRANATLTWEITRWSVSWTTRYFDGYYFNTAHTVLAAQAAAKEPSQSYHDISVSYRTGVHTRALLSRWDFQGGVNNVFNRRPPIDTSSVAGYSYLGDPRLAFYYLSARKSF